MATYKPGEIVDITIRGARVSDSHVQDRYLHLTEPGDGGRHFYLRLPLPEGITVERVASTEPTMARKLADWYGDSPTAGVCQCCRQARPVYQGYTGGQPLGVAVCAGCRYSHPAHAAGA